MSKRIFRKGSIARKGMHAFLLGKKAMRKGRAIAKKAESYKAKAKSYGSRAKSAKGHIAGAIKALKGGRRKFRPIRVGRKALKMSPMQLNKTY